ncbi:hypothetical protein Patl1_17085 [Pistacia atlantica]|uniref:Uncharacterized protein n=1 Tax=Pistacia atlantica TaxID=434234 RepID=A0ACC1BB65_9ROSI|nr:hypothetical protein Patl1_17085 [Pistacia atlantica]
MYLDRGLKDLKVVVPSMKSYLEPIPTNENGHLPADFVMDDPDSHFIYVCKKMDEKDLSNKPTHPMEADIL